MEKTAREVMEETFDKLSFVSQDGNLAFTKDECVNLMEAYLQVYKDKVLNISAREIANRACDKDQDDPFWNGVVWFRDKIFKL